MWRCNSSLLLSTLLLVSVLIQSESSAANSSEIRVLHSENSPPFIGTNRLPTKWVIGTNLAPIYFGEYSLQVEHFRTRRISFHLSAGIAPEPRYGTYLKKQLVGFSDIGRGFFVRPGIDYQFIRNSSDNRYKKIPLEPFVGLRLNYYRITEDVLTSPFDPLSSIVEFEEKTSDNLGIGLAIGGAINFSKIISLQIGIQFSTDLLENRENSLGYTPGQGLDWEIFKTQAMATLRLKIFTGERVVEMSRR